MNSSPAKGRRLIQTKIQEVDSRFSQRHLRLNSCGQTVDGNEHWHPWSNWNSQILQEISYYTGILLFLSRNSKVEKYYENIPFEERPATANSASAVCNPRTFPAIHKILTSLTTPVRSVSCESSFSDLRRPVYNERGTLEWLREAPYSWWDGLHTGTWGDLPNETKVAEVNEPSFVLTGFPEVSIYIVDSKP